MIRTSVGRLFCRDWCKAFGSCPVALWMQDSRCSLRNQQDQRSIGALLRRSSGHTSPLTCAHRFVCLRGPKDTAGFVPATTGDSLLQLCCTACQQKALWTFLEAINGMANSSCPVLSCLRSPAMFQEARARDIWHWFSGQRVLSLTGRRGRGKSSVAALGMVALLQRRISVVVTGPGSNRL